MMRLEILLTLFVIALMYMTTAMAEDHGEGKVHRRGPPPVAIEACSSSTNGQICSFNGRRGDVVEGICVTTRNDVLACRPDKPRKGRRAQPSGEIDTPIEN